MTKVAQLNVFLSERLAAAVKEILDTVSRMVQEYEEETARICKENEYLKEMLTLTGWSFTEINPGVSLGRQDGVSDPQQESETWEGWCQNQALKEESRSIKIEQPDPPYLAHPEFEHTDRCPTPVLGTCSSISNVWSSSENCKGNAKLKLKKKHHCLYCKKPSNRMAQHLLSAHAKEPEVAKALSYDKKSKERKQLLNLLQSKGSLLHKDVGMSRTLLSSKRHTKAGSKKDDAQCVYCLGLYGRKVIANHVKRCKHKYSSGAETAIASLVAGSDAFQQGASSCTKIPEANLANLSNTNAVACNGKQPNPNPDCASSHVADTGHNAAQLYTDTQSAASSAEDFESVSEQLLAGVESPSDLNSDTSSPACDQTETIKSEDNKTDAEQSSRNRPTVQNRRRSFHIETQSKLLDSPSEEKESAAQSTQLHSCQHCSATFCSPYHLRRHEYTHTGERPFWCSECNMGFIQKYRYRNHRMIYHERHISLYKDQSGRRKKRSCSEERPSENELHQQQLAESSAGTTEASSDFEERV